MNFFWTASSISFRAAAKLVLVIAVLLGGSFFIRAQVPAQVHADTLAVADSLNQFDTLAAVDTLATADTLVTCVSRNTAFTVKSNLLFDLATALNVDVEFPIANRYSLMVEDVFPWWSIGNKYALQMWEMGAEARFWFKPWEKMSTQKMRGWFAGAYCMSARYDFQFDTAINYQGQYWSAGVTGGYVAPLGKKKRLNMEFSLSVGYLEADYQHYQPTDDYLKLIRDPYSVGTVRYFGPTKLKVSLVIPVNFSKKEANND